MLEYGAGLQISQPLVVEMLMGFSSMEIKLLVLLTGTLQIITEMIVVLALQMETSMLLVGIFVGL